MQVAYDGNIQVSGLIFSSRIAPLYLFLLSPFSWLSSFYMLWSLNFLSFLIHSCQLHFHLPSHPFYLWCMTKNHQCLMCIHLLKSLDDTHSLHLSTCLKHSSLVAFLDCFPPKINKTADIPTFRHIIALPTCFWPASLAWFVGDGGNNYGVMKESMRLRKAKRDELCCTNFSSSGRKFLVTDIKSFFPHQIAEDRLYEELNIYSPIYSELEDKVEASSPADS